MPRRDPEDWKVWPVFLRPASKVRLARRIIGLMPQHSCYVEPFVGDGGILINKPPSEYDVISDPDPDIIRAWRAIRDRPGRVHARLREAAYSRETWWAALAALATSAVDDIDHSVSYIIRNRMSRRGLGRAYAWDTRTRGGKPLSINSWEHMLADFTRVAERINLCMISHGDGRSVAETYGFRADALIYCDPPAFSGFEGRRRRRGELTRDQHYRLLLSLNNCSCSVMITGTHSHIYDQLLKGWDLHEFSVPERAAPIGSGGRRVECLWVRAASDMRGSRR